MRSCKKCNFYGLHYCDYRCIKPPKPVKYNGGLFTQQDVRSIIQQKSGIVIDRTVMGKIVRELNALKM